MEKYKRVEKKKDGNNDEISSNSIGKNEIRITQKGKISGYVKYGQGIFQDNSDTVILKALGNAISKGIIVVEILKRTIPNLYQITQIGTMETIDIYEPLEEGLDVVETVRQLPTLTVTLSKTPLDNNHPGYQEPLSPSQIRSPRRRNSNAGSGTSGNKNNNIRKSRRRSIRKIRGRGRGGSTKSRDNENTYNQQEVVEDENEKAYEEQENEQLSNGANDIERLEKTETSSYRRGGKNTRGAGRGRGGRSGRGGGRGGRGMRNRRSGRGGRGGYGGYTNENSNEGHE